MIRGCFFWAPSTSAASSWLERQVAELLKNNCLSLRDEMRSKQVGNDKEDRIRWMMRILVRQLEAIMRISEPLSKMAPETVVHEAHNIEDMRLSFQSCDRHRSAYCQHLRHRFCNCWCDVGRLWWRRGVSKDRVGRFVVSFVGVELWGEWKILWTKMQSLLLLNALGAVDRRLAIVVVDNLADVEAASAYRNDYVCCLRAIVVWSFLDVMRVWTTMLHLWWRTNKNKRTEKRKIKEII